MPDLVNHPPHYESGKYECIDVMQEAIGSQATKDFCLCNAFKYVYRCNHKHSSPVEDVKKAIWYLNKYIELEGSDEMIKWEFDAKKYDENSIYALGNELSDLLLKFFPNNKDFRINIKVDDLSPVDIHFKNPEVE